MLPLLAILPFIVNDFLFVRFQSDFWSILVLGTIVLTVSGIVIDRGITGYVRPLAA